MYITVAQADVYFAGSTRQVEWGAVTDKEALIKRASQRIEAIPFKTDTGNRTADRYVNGENVPNKILIATAELSLWYNTNRLDQNTALEEDVDNSLSPFVSDLPMVVQNALFIYLATIAIPAEERVQPTQGKSIPLHGVPSESGEVAPIPAGSGVTEARAQEIVNTHRQIPDAHHTPGTGGGVDQTARTAAAQAQSEIDTHEGSTHNTDTTARAEINTHENSTHNTDEVARTAAQNALNFAHNIPAGVTEEDLTDRFTDFLDMIKQFAVVGNDEKPLASDIAVDPENGYQPNTSYEMGQRIEGGIRKPQWVPRPTSSGGFFISFTTRPTADNIAVGGWAAAGGHVLVVPADGPEEIWVRYTTTSALVKVATFADHIVRPLASGQLPTANLNRNRIGIGANGFFRSVNHGHAKLVTFDNYGPTRTAPPTVSAQELLYGGSVANPPHSTIGNFVVNTILWDRGSEVWIIKPSAGATQWSTYSGPIGYHTGRLYLTEGDAAVHVANATEVGDIYIIGHGANQKPEIVKSVIPAAADDWQWDFIGTSIQDVVEIVNTHNASATAHTNIRDLITALTTTVDGITNTGSTVTGAQIVTLLSALTGDARLSHGDLKNNPNIGTLITDIANKLQIAAYSTTGSYSRGSANSIVTHGNNVYIYTSGTARTANHDPSTHPNYWANFTTLANTVIVDNTTNTHFRLGNLIITHEDEVYLCATNAQAGTARNLAYVKANSGVGGEFVHLTDKIPTTWKGPHVGGTTYQAGDRVTTANNTRLFTALQSTNQTPPGNRWIETLGSVNIPDNSIAKAKLNAALREEIDIVEVSEHSNNNITYHAGASIVRVGTVLYQCRQGYTTSFANPRTPGTTAGMNHWDTLLVFREYDSEPSGDVPDGVVGWWAE